MDPGTLSQPPVPLQRREQIGVWIAAAGVALTRLFAISQTLWDWDEALFVLAVRDYDVTRHHPHPPGFPLWIAAGKLVPLDAFHALQAISVVSAFFVFPAMFFLARELRLRPFAAIAAALLLAFFPNVWFFGGTAFSDVPSMVLALVASALLLRGCRSSSSLFAGAVVLGIAAGVRPQNLLIGLVPFVVALLHRRRAAVAAGAVTAAIVVVSFAGAAFFSGGWEPYREAVQKHEQYIRGADSFLSPLRPGLLQVADDFLLRPYRAPVLNAIVAVLAVLGLRHWRRLRVALLIFGPFLVFAWLFLDFHSASRFSIAYVPLFAILAAEGIPHRGRWLTLAAAVGAMIFWTWPALRVVRTTVSPPVAALGSVRALPSTTVVYVDERLAAHAEWLIPEYERHVVTPRPGWVVPRGALLVREGASIAPGARVYERDSDRVAGIARKRYFAVSVIPGR